MPKPPSQSDGGSPCERAQECEVDAEGRAELVKWVLFEKQSVKEVSCAMGASRRTVYKWVKHYEVEGVSGPQDRSSQPRQSPRRSSERLVKQIERLRRRKSPGA